MAWWDLTVAYDFLTSELWPAVITFAYQNKKSLWRLCVPSGLLVSSYHIRDTSSARSHRLLLAISNCLLVSFLFFFLFLSRGSAWASGASCGLVGKWHKKWGKWQVATPRSTPRLTFHGRTFSLHAHARTSTTCASFFLRSNFEHLRLFPFNRFELVFESTLCQNLMKLREKNGKHPARHLSFVWCLK